MYIVVTGAAGFIGSNIVKALGERGEHEVLAVDDLEQGGKFVNLADCDIADYVDKDDFLRELNNGAFDGSIAAISHQGACSDTTVTDGRYMMRNNYRYSRELLEYCIDEEIPYIYASSAAVYGAGPEFREGRACEAPLNVYGYSKFLFDQYVRRNWAERTAQVVGLRYFNVYGEREQHKGRMASVAFHFFNEYRASGTVKLFEGSGGYGNGEQRRDFISVEDVVKVNLYFLDNPGKTGIFNCGTGASQTFNDIALMTINALRRAEGKNPLSLAELRTQGMIEYLSFPAGLREKYQSYTQADLAQLRGSGYAAPFFDVETGVTRYVEWLLDAAR